MSRIMLPYIILVPSDWKRMLPNLLHVPSVWKTMLPKIIRYLSPLFDRILAPSFGKDMFHGFERVPTCSICLEESTGISHQCTNTLSYIWIIKKRYIILRVYLFGTVPIDLKCVFVPSV